MRNIILLGLAATLGAASAQAQPSAQETKSAPVTLNQGEQIRNGVSASGGGGTQVGEGVYGSSVAGPNNSMAGASHGDPCKKSTPGRPDIVAKCQQQGRSNPNR